MSLLPRRKSSHTAVRLSCLLSVPGNGPAAEQRSRCDINVCQLNGSLYQIDILFHPMPNVKFSLNAAKDCRLSPRESNATFAAKGNIRDNRPRHAISDLRHSAPLLSHKAAERTDAILKAMLVPELHGYQFEEQNR